jgi:hypothetical protein
VTCGYLFALAVTLAVEVPVVAAIFRGQRLRMAVVCALATTVTHIVMHFLIPRIASSHEDVVIIGELQALVVEAVLYGLLSHPRDWPRALVASALANSASYGAGFLIGFAFRL